MDKDEERRKKIIEKLNSLSTGTSDFMEKAKKRARLKRITRKKYIVERANELYPISSPKDLKNKLQNDGWVEGYSEALKNITDCLEDEEVMDNEAEFFAKLYILSNKEEITQENIDKYKKIFKDVISHFVLLRIKDDGSSDKL